MAYRFGPFVLNPECHLLLQDGAPVPLTAKVLETLVVLVQNRGRVMDKDELVAALWPDTVVEEANLTQNISTLRKALGDNPKDHFYIATIAGRGYRFVGPVTESPTGAQSTERDLKQPHAFWRPNRVLQFAAACILITMVASIAFWLLRQPGRGQWTEPIPVTSREGFASFPAFSPDGKQIAYSWTPSLDSESSIYVKLIGGDTELRITDPPGDDISPAWSPDGKSIAFYRDVQGKSGYYVVSALGGPVRQILQTRDQDFQGLDWFPDGKHIAVSLATAEPPRYMPFWGQHRIVSVDIETREQKYLTRPELGNVLKDSLPKVAPNGTLVAFVRARAANSSEICLVGRDGSSMRQLTNVGADLRSIAWTPDSRGLVWEMFREGRTRLWRMSIDGGVPAPITSSLEWVGAPALARQGNLLAYVVSTGQTSLWRLSITGPHPPTTGGPIRVIYSTRYDGQPMSSSDGHRIAFSSNRSGPHEIWVSDADGRAPFKLTNLGGPNNGSPQWSPDGSEIAFDSIIQGNPEIVVVTVQDRSVRRITHHPAEDVVPSWSNDGRWIYFASNRSGDFQIYRLPARQTESPSNAPVQVTTGGGINAVESPDGNYLYFAKGRGKRGLWRRRLAAPDQGKEEEVLEALQFWGWWALGPNGIFFLEGEKQAQKVHLKFLDLTSMQVTDLRMLDYPVNGDVRPITVLPDGRNVVYEQDENHGSNVVLIDNFR